MKLLIKIARRLHAFASYVEQPHLLAARRQGVPVALSSKLNAPWLKAMGFRTIVDIGANEGQFALAASLVWPKAQIYSFEPLPDCFERMQHRLRHVKAFRAFNVGLGDEKGTVNLERSQFAPSSSFLPMGSTHKEEYPHTWDCHKVAVKVERLDDVASELTLQRPLMIKIDVQGFEDRVLKGGDATVRNADLLIVESSFEVLYEGQPLFNDVYQWLWARGFVYKGMLDQATSPRDARPLQADGIFVKGS